MAVGESLTNLVFTAIADLNQVKCSANWMWAPKLPGEGARLYDAAVAMRLFNHRRPGLPWSRGDGWSAAGRGNSHRCHSANSRSNALNRETWRTWARCSPR